MEDARRSGPGTAGGSAPSAREIRTFLDPGTSVNGKLSFSTPTRIEGKLKGEVRASALLVIARGGLVDGTIWARQLVVEGVVKGQILGAERVEIQPGALVSGGIETQTLVVADGASFEGDCRMGVAASPFGQPARG